MYEDVGEVDMFQQATIWIPTTQFFIELITAYYIIGFAPWLAWCVSETYHDYGRRSKELKPKEVIRLIAAWTLWPAPIEVTRNNFDPKRFNRSYKYYR